MNSPPPRKGKLTHGPFQKEVIGEKAVVRRSNWQSYNMVWEIKHDRKRSRVKVMVKEAGEAGLFPLATLPSTIELEPLCFHDGQVPTGQLWLVRKGSAPSSFCSPETGQLVQACASGRKPHSQAILLHKWFPSYCWNHACWFPHWPKHILRLSTDSPVGNMYLL